MSKWHNDSYKMQRDAFENPFSITDFAEQLVDLVYENKKLKRENEKLRKENEGHKQYIDDQYQRTMSQTGELLSTLAKNLPDK